MGTKDNRQLFSADCRVDLSWQMHGWIDGWVGGNTVWIMGLLFAVQKEQSL